jgi:arylsulfatase A-like enzyme
MGRGHALLLASLTPVLAGCSGEVRPPEPRSVILVTCDTLRRDALEPYGAAPGCTPHLARLAQEAVVFDQAWSAAPSTLPSLSSLFTRRTPDELGVTSGNRMLLPPEVDTLTERLREAGLETAAVVSNAVLRRFPTPIGEVALAQGFDHYDDRMTAKERNRQLFERSAPDTVAAGLQWLDARKDPEGPVFLWLHFIEPHGPYTSGEPLALSEDDALPAALPLGEDDRGLGQIPRYQALGEERAPARYRAAYRGEVRHLDQALGVLLEGLRQRGLLETATLVVTADHGESLGEGDWWFSHGQSLAPELLRVPLLIRAPGGSAPARRSQLAGPFAVHDAILAAAGALPASRSLLAPGPSRGSAPSGSALVVQARGRPGTATHELAITDGRFRLAWTAGGEERLHDLWDDPEETRDLSASWPQVAQDLRRRYLGELDARAGLPAVEALHVNDIFDLRAAAKHAEELEALGYGGD